MSNIPRRNRIDLFTTAETAIWNAVQVVEAAGCDVRLTHAVNKLQEARDLVADFVDGVPLGEGYPRVRCLGRVDTIGGQSQVQCGDVAGHYGPHRHRMPGEWESSTPSKGKPEP